MRSIDQNYTQNAKTASLCIVCTAQNAISGSKLYTKCENSDFVYSLHRSERDQWVKTIHKMRKQRFCVVCTAQSGNRWVAVNRFQEKLFTWEVLSTKKMRFKQEKKLRKNTINLLLIASKTKLSKNHLIIRIN